MIKKILRRVLILLILAGLAGGAYLYWNNRPTGPLTLTGIVTQDGVNVGSQVAGRINELAVKEGDRVQAGQLLAVIEPKELNADVEYFSHSIEGFEAQVKEAQSSLKYQEVLTRDQIAQAEKSLAVARAQSEESAADLERTRLDAERYGKLVKEGVLPAQVYDQARTAHDAVKARAETLRKQVDAQQAALELARTNAEQIPIRRDQVAVSLHQVAAAGAQKQKAQVRAGYTEIRSPIAGVVNVRAALAGEVVNPAQAIVTLIDEDAFWVRVDVPESYLDQARLGNKLPVRLASGAERTGTIFFRGADAGFATQRDVSRTKRDIKTFEVRLRVDNSDRALALGMSAYVTLPVDRERNASTK